MTSHQMKKEQLILPVFVVNANALRERLDKHNENRRSV